MKIKFYIKFTSNGCKMELAYKAKNEEEALKKFQIDMKKNNSISEISVSKEATLTHKKESPFIRTSSISKTRTTRGSARALIG